MYCELHARSAFSFLEGASLPEDLATVAARLGLPALAITDAAGVYGAPRAHLAAGKHGLRAIVGAEIPLAGGGRLPVLVETREGYRNLCRLLTTMKMRAARGAGAVAWDELGGHAAGLVALSGGPEGPVHRSPADMGATLDALLRAFGPGNVYAELQRHFDRREESVNQALVAAAASRGLPLVATSGASHAAAAERDVADVFTCIREGVRVDDAGRRLARNVERHLKGGAEMARLFRDVPGAVERTADVAARLDFTLDALGYEFPRYPVPGGETPIAFLRKRTDEGARRRYRPYHARARAQVERELALIEKLDLAGYFLIVWEIVEWSRAAGILVQGRGSAANSAVCYALGITAVDPVGMDLLFERFLSEERGEWPDIDLDLPSGERREKVIQHVYDRYGARGAAMTANVITYRGRSAIREVGKALGFEAPLLDRLSTLVTNFEYRGDGDTADRPFREAGLDLADPRVAQWLRLYQAVQDLPRHLGQHSGGMVVCQGQLDLVVPLEPASMPGRVVVQWDKDDCAAMGMVKVDLLGLGMMSVLQDTLEIVRGAEGVEIDLAHLPPDDPAVYAALCRADTIGLFQVESRAQMSCLPRLRPKTFYDIVVQVAIIRPGPIVGEMVHPYLRRRRGLEPPDCLHPALEPVLARTLGVPLFQEQLLRMAMIAAGFSGGEAEELRRAFGFKRSEKRMKEIEVKLRRGMERLGLAGAARDRIVQSITSFALYGFPESHAASFALLAYASGWLKCHHLAAFTAATLNNQPMGFYSPATIVKDAQRHGLRVRPVDVTRSAWPCAVEAGDLRLGLNQVKGLRQSAAEALVAARESGPFRNVADLARRVPALRRDELTRLAELGALNGLPSASGPRHRRDALWDAERAARPAGEFTGDDGPDAAGPLPAMNDEDRLAADVAGLGLSLGAHPVRRHRERLARMGVSRAADLRTLADGTPVRVAGSVIVRQRPGTAKGFVFLSLEDETGIANAIVTPRLFESGRRAIVAEPFLLIDGVLQNQENVVSVKARRIAGLALPAPAAASHDFR